MIIKSRWVLYPVILGIWFIIFILINCTKLVENVDGQIALSLIFAVIIFNQQMIIGLLKEQKTSKWLKKNETPVIRMKK